MPSSEGRLGGPLGTVVAAVLGFAVGVGVRQGSVVVLGSNAENHEPRSEVAPCAAPGRVGVARWVRAAAVLAESARVRQLHERLEPSVAGEADTVDVETLERAAGAVGDYAWVDCGASPCVVRFPTGSGAPKALSDALRQQPGLEGAYVVSWSVSGIVQLAVWPAPPSDAELAAANERLLTLHRGSDL